MVWCSSCGRDQPVDVDYTKGFVCCTGCGKVIDDNIYSEETTFTKLADGSSQAVGSIVSEGSIGGSLSKLGGSMSGKYGFRVDSHEQTLRRGTDAIFDIAERLSIRPLNDSVNAAKRLYQLGLQRRFTTGRRIMHVAAACIYIVCRQEKKPYLLIDFSDILQTNVFVLGAVFVQLCRILHLEQHPILQTPIDPSLFIHRYAHQLDFGKKMHAVSETALRLVASMKRDWIQTGRKPGGICGAALFIAAHVHGFHTTKKDIISIVHVSESTLQFRLVEFENTPSGNLNVQEFEDQAKDYENQRKLGIDSDMVMAQLNQSLHPSFGESGVNENNQVICTHKDAPAFGFGLCKECFNKFMEVSGGIFSGESPPSFIRSENASKKKEREKEDERRVNELQTSSAGNSEPLLLETQPSQTNPVSFVREKQPIRRSKMVDDSERKRITRKNEENESSLPSTINHSNNYINENKIISSNSFLNSNANENENENEQEQEQEQEKENENDPFFPKTNDDGDDVFFNKDFQLLDAEMEKVRKENEQKEDGMGGDKFNFTVEDIPEGKEEKEEREEEGEEKEEEKEEEEEDTFSDIDDAEVDAYFLGEKEVEMKTLIWESMNVEYLEKMELKKQAEEAQEALRNSILNFDDAEKVAGMDPAELAAAAAAAIAAGKSKKPRKPRKKSDGKSEGAHSAMESAQRMIAKKRMSTKINYSALENLFGNYKDNNLKSIEENGEEEEEEKEDDNKDEDMDGFKMHKGSVHGEVEEDAGDLMKGLTKKMKTDYDHSNDGDYGNEGEPYGNYGDYGGDNDYGGNDDYDYGGGDADY